MRVFSAVFMCVQSVFLLVHVLNKQVTASENIPPLKGEDVVGGDGNYFYRAVVL